MVKQVLKLNISKQDAQKIQQKVETELSKKFVCGHLAQSIDNHLKVHSDIVTKNHDFSSFR